MSYQCQDCSFKGKQFPGGACPACGSNNVSRLGAQSSPEPVKKDKKLNFYIMIACWATLLVLIMNKLVFS